MGRKNPEVSGDWEVTQEDLNVETSDTGEMSGAFEELENRSAIENTLEERFIFSKQGARQHQKGAYGVCSSKEGKAHPIESKRLEANPAATECIKHSGI